MLPFKVDPGWYEEHWLSERPRPRRKSLAGKLTRFALVVALVVGGGAVLSRLHVNHDANAYQDWEQE